MNKHFYHTESCLTDHIPAYFIEMTCMSSGPRAFRGPICSTAIQTSSVVSSHVKHSLFLSKISLDKRIASWMLTFKSFLTSYRIPLRKPARQHFGPPTKLRFHPLLSNKICLFLIVAAIYKNLV